MLLAKQFPKSQPRLQVYRRLWGETQILPLLGALGGVGGLVLFKDEISAAFLNDYRARADILGSEGSYHATRIAACAKPCAKPDSPLVQVFRAVSAGNFCLSEKERRELIVREAPLKELKGIVTCTGIEKSYFVVTGEQAVCQRTRSIRVVSCSTDLVALRCDWNRPQRGGEEHAGRDGLLRGKGARWRARGPSPDW